MGKIIYKGVGFIMFPENLSTRIKLLCDQRRLSQQSFAEKCGLSVRYVGRLACGHSVPSLTVLEKICFATALSPDELLFPPTAYPGPQWKRVPFPPNEPAPRMKERHPLLSVCPRCGFQLEGEMHPLCRRCGQALSWYRLTGEE